MLVSVFEICILGTMVDFLAAFAWDVAVALERAALTDFAQEIVVLVVFAASFWAWRRTRVRKGTRSPKLVSLGVIPAMVLQQVSDKSKNEVTSSDDEDSNSGAPSPPRCQAQRTVPASCSLPVVRAAEKQIMRHLSQFEFTRALNLYRTFERDGRDRFFSEELFAAFIQSATRVGKVDVIERMVRTMRRNNIDPSLRFWQATFKMLSSRKRYHTCLLLHSIYAKRLPNDKVIYSCLVNAALELGDSEKANAMLECYASSEIETKDYVLFFRTYVATGNVDAAEAFFQKLGANMTSLMLNLLLLTCVNKNDVSRAHRLLREAHGLEEGNGGEPIVDTVSYNTVFKGYMHEGLSAKCLGCLREMLDRNLEPDDVTFTTLIDAFVVDSDLGAASEVVSLLMSRCKPMDTVMCTMFMKALVRSNCLDEAMQLYDEMRRRNNASLDVVTYSVLMKGLVDQHELERALNLLEDMTNVGLAPDDIILTHLLEGCRHVGNHALGKKLFEDMLAAGVKPSAFTLVTMLKLHGRCGAHSHAYDLVANWEAKHGIQPSVIHYTCVMSGCLRTKKYDQAWATYELMRERGVSPDETTLSTILPGLVVGQQWERLLLIVRRVLEAPVPLAMPAETLNNALSQMIATSGTGRYASQLHQLMFDAGVPITDRNARRLG